MKEFLTLTALLLLVFALNEQQLEVEGKMLIKDINTIATFRSSVKNSFIRLEINNNPSMGTSIGYFLDTFDGAAETFYIDTPREGFGEFLISEGLVFIRDGLHVDGEGIVGTATTGSGYGVLGLGFVSGVARCSRGQYKYRSDRFRANMRL